MWWARETGLRHLPAAGVCVAMLAGVLPASAGAADVTAVADTYVDQGRPHATHAGVRRLRLSRSPLRRAYVRFRLPEDATASAGVSLHLFVAGRTGGRLRVHRLADGSDWTQRPMSFSRAPRIDGPGIRSPRVRRRGWVTIDVSGLVDPGRIVDFALTGAPRASVASRESRRPPRLTVPPPVVRPGPLPPPAFPPPPPPPPAAKLTMVQDSDPEAAAQVTYEVDSLPPVTLTGDELRTLTLERFGRQTASVRMPIGWTLAAIDCTGPAEPDIESGEVRLDLKPGATITCRFHVQQDARVVVAQDGEPSTGPPIGYATRLGDFELAGDAERTIVVRAGDFGRATITQGGLPGWVASPPACTGDAKAAASGRTAALDIDPGEVITCRFAVKEPAPIPGIYPETSSSIGPFVDGNGALYTVTEVAFDVDKAAIRKSADGGRTWIEVGGERRPTIGDLESVSLVQDGSRIHMLHQRSGYKVFYNVFTTSDAPDRPDRWLLVNEQPFEGNTTSTAPHDQSASLAVRENGDVLAFYVISETEIAYRKRSAESGAWGPQQVLDVAPAGRELTQVFAARASADDTIHIAYKEHTPTGWLRSPVLYRTLSPDDVLSPPLTVAENAASGPGTYKVMPNGGLVLHDVGGTDRVHVAWERTDGRLVESIVEAGAVASEHVISDTVAYENPFSVKSNQVVAALAPGAADGIVHALYADAETHDLWADRRAGAWGPDVELLDGTDVMAINARVVEHSPVNGGRTVLGVILDRDTGIADDGAVEYAEVELPSEPAP